MSIFEKQLKLYLQNSLQELSAFEGVKQPQKELLEKAVTDSSQNVFSLVASYNDFVEERQSVQLETLLKKQVIKEEFKKSKVPLYAMPHIYQSLPRCSNGDGKILDEIKKNFTNFQILKRHLIDKALLSLYEKVSLPNEENITLFTYVMKDGLGDLIAQEEAFGILQKDFTQIIRIVLVPAEYKALMHNFSGQSLIHYYGDKEELHFDCFSEAIKKALDSTFLLLQIPTYYPHFDLLIQKYKPKVHQTIGEYGFIDSTWAHPMKENTCCMGLHFLEKGIFIKKMPKKHQLKLSQAVKETIFGNSTYTRYKQETDFIFAYLKTATGTETFLHLALTYYSTSKKDLDLAFIDAHLILLLIKEGRFPSCEYSIKELRICVKEGNYVIPVAKEGKVLRIIELGSLSSEDAKALVVLSEKLTACRGDQSFSEAVSASAPFFYDGALHAGPFLHDLQAIAIKRTKAFPSAIAFIYGCLESFHAKKEACSTAEIGRNMGRLLLDPLTSMGLKKLCRILKTEYLFNNTLLQLIKRALLRSAYPELARMEEDHIQVYLMGNTSLFTILEQIKHDLRPKN